MSSVYSKLSKLYGLAHKAIKDATTQENTSEWGTLFHAYSTKHFSTYTSGTCLAAVGTVLFTGAALVLTFNVVKISLQG